LPKILPFRPNDALNGFDKRTWWIARIFKKSSPFADTISFQSRQQH